MHPRQSTFGIVATDQREFRSVPIGPRFDDRRTELNQIPSQAYLHERESFRGLHTAKSDIAQELFEFLISRDDAYIGYCSQFNTCARQPHLPAHMSQTVEENRGCTEID